MVHCALEEREKKIELKIEKNRTFFFIREILLFRRFMKLFMLIQNPLNIKRIKRKAVSITDYTIPTNKKGRPIGLPLLRNNFAYLVFINLAV